MDEIRITFNILGNTFNLRLQHFKTPTAPTLGVSPRIPHTTDFMLFMDYDNIVDPRLIDELLYLIELFRVGDFHVFASSEFNRHAVCIDRMPPREAYEIVYHSSCDGMFKRGISISEYRSWVLRIAVKGNRPPPKYLYTVKSRYNGERLQGEGMGLFLKHYYGAKVRLPNPDGFFELEATGYLTGSKLDVRKLEKIKEAKQR